MKNEDAVFSSDITKSECDLKNNLYDLLNIVPANPLPLPSVKNQDGTCNFTPNSNKRFVPQTRSKLKVKTVRDIRTSFEEDVYSYLPEELEKQQRYLLKKISNGFSTNEYTINTAKSILNGNQPISTSAWQMLANLNPHNQKCSKQFVLWNGKCIQVNGSRGGKNKFICNYDLKSHTTHITKKFHVRNSVFKRKVGLLRNNLHIKFKPGPLQKKKFLDDSHHKYHMGNVEIIKLPKPALDIFPSYGTTLERTATGFVSDVRGESGIISPKWAEYAVSVLGKISNNIPVQLDKDCCITFDLNYKCDQSRLLMRRNSVDSVPFTNEKDPYHNKKSNEETPTTLEVQDIVEKIIDSVEISLDQNNMYSVDDDFKNTKFDENVEIIVNTKEKSKKKLCELNRLDVTVIKLPQTSHKVSTEPCGKLYCSLGCICESLNCTFNIRQHCGVLGCMFGCSCDLSKFKAMEFLERDSSEIIPGLLKLDNELNSRLAKEEQKFHQTVIVSGEKSILLKSRKRKCKSSTKYAEFYSDMNSKSKENIKKVLKILDVKVNCKNIEPLCMVHNLYKCFCRGKFTDTSYKLTNETNTTTVNQQTKEEVNKVDIKIATDNNAGSDIKPLRPHRRQVSKKYNNILGSVTKNTDNVIDHCSDIYEYNDGCARTAEFSGRKYSDGYYKNTNEKIMIMEQNDKFLAKKMLSLINKSNEKYRQTSKKSSESESGDVSLYYDDVSNDSNTENGENEIQNDFSFNSGTKGSLKAWLEVSYRWYKERIARGLVINILGPPREGLSCLLPWDVILSRYRERKNVYFVSKQPPYRTYLGVNPKYPFFANHINIDDISIADLLKYPVIIQNLVTNVVKPNNSFCMLRGWDQCWEIIGSAVKIVENDCQKSTERFVKENLEKHGSLTSDSEDWLTHEKLPPLENDLSKSKWFIMKIENNFTEIQFTTRGFFVTYEGIQRSIKLARDSGNTVRLSSQARSDKNSTTQYGIYAIPSTSESCVFIGPYEKNEPLGIEIVKKCAGTSKQGTTRGVWITTNKIDNMKVIDNPLLFMPSVSVANEKKDFGAGTSTSGIITSGHREQLIEIPQNVEPEKETTKIIKPIKICRTNILQKLSESSSKSLLVNKKHILMKGPISSLKKNCDILHLVNESNETSSTATSVAYVKPFCETAIKLKKSDGSVTNMNTPPRPVAEIAPQIKITSVYSQSTLQTNVVQTSPKKNSCMLILKPDEINNKILGLNKNTVEYPNNEEIDETSVIDVEAFLEKSAICKIPEDVLVISDCEDDNVTCSDVWIQCRNIVEFGCISGRMTSDKLSFKIPGFNNSKFYTLSKAIHKINQILARKIYIPKNMRLQWKILKSQVPNCILTSEHLRNELYLLNMIRKLRVKLELERACPEQTVNTKEIEKQSVSTSEHKQESCEAKVNSEDIILIDQLDESSIELEERGMDLLNEAVTRQNEIGGTLIVSKNRLAEMTVNLLSILNSNKALEDPY